MERTKQGEFAWLDLSAGDLAAQTVFYEDLFGWTHEDIPTGEGRPDYRMFSKDGATVGGAMPISPDMAAAGVPTMWNTYIAVDDADAAAARAVDLGGRIIMPAMDVMDMGRMVGIQDPTGGSVFLWHNSKPTETMRYFAPGTLGWNDLSTRDPGAAAAFFSELLGWQIKELDNSPMPYWQISIDGQGEGGIMPMPEMVPPEVPAYWLVYFGAQDARSQHARAVFLGATSLVEPTEIADMLVWSVLADPAGATFALMQALTA